MSVNPFAFVTALTETKNQDVYDEFALTHSDRDYPSFVINNAISYHIDTVLYANEMNISGPLPPIMQWDYYLNSIAPRKRYAKWVKKTNSKANTDLVQEYYKCGLSEAKDIVKDLSPDDLIEIKTRLDKGGR